MLNVRNYDFERIRTDKRVSVFNGCLARRFAAALFDAFLLLGGLLLYIYLRYGLDKDLKADVTLPFLAGMGVLFYLPELLFRQTPGMALFGLVLIAPLNRPPWFALLIRKIVNIAPEALILFPLPGAFYYYFIAGSRDHRSLSDRISGCLVAQKRFLLTPQAAPPRAPSRPRALLVATMFFLAPVALLILVVIYWPFHLKLSI